MKTIPLWLFPAVILLFVLPVPRAHALPQEVEDAVPRSAWELLQDGVLEPEDSGAGYGTGYGADSGTDYGTEYGADRGMGYGTGYGVDSGTDYGTGYGSDSGTDYGTEYGADSFTRGVGRILEKAGAMASGVFRKRLRSSASVLLAVILCGAARSGLKPDGELAVSLAGALSVTALSAGSLEDLIGLGWKTIRELDGFARALLPALAAASAVSGAPSTAAIARMLAMLLSGLLLRLIDTVLMPLLYLYIGVLTASCALPGNRLDLLAEGLKKAVTGILTAALLGFTIYLSVSRVIAGTADGAALRITKAAVARAVPVVGGILAEASEAVLAGAGVLRNSVGVFGMLAVLAACVYPFLQLGIQYLLYKAAAFLAAAAGMPDLCRLLDGLGGAFALVLGMTAACALLLLVSALCFVTAAAG